MTHFLTRIGAVQVAARFVVLAAALTCTALAGCVDPVSMVASSVLSAAIKTTIEQADMNQPTPDELWQEAQLANLERQARAGIPEAQFRLGTYYIQAQEPVAQEWICAAANQGHASAQLQYGHWFNEDRSREDLFPFISITPDNSDAFLWYALAARNGEPRAAHFRDSLIYGGIQTVKLDHARARLVNWSAQVCAAAPSATLTAGDPSEDLSTPR